jgi:3D (Asp-Asp-Asp) domain-containing protein
VIRVSLLAVAVVVAAVACSKRSAGQTELTASLPKTLVVEVTFYGWPDNDPPGDAIAYPVVHQRAGGTGTWADPITLASDKRLIPIGSRIYIGYLHKYFVMEDQCVPCEADWSAKRPHIDLWIGGEGAPPKEVLACEDRLTRSSYKVTVGETDPNYPVDPTPLFGPNGCIGGIPDQGR